METYRRQLGHHHRDRRQEIHHKQDQVIMRIVRADQEQTNRHAEQELLGRRVLVLVVDLLPHVEVVVRARVELERDPAHVVEHEVRGAVVGGVDERPGGLLRDAGNDVVEDFEEEDEDDVDEPGACDAASDVSVVWVSMSVGEGRLFSPFAFTHCEFRFGSTA